MMLQAVNSIVQKDEQTAAQRQQEQPLQQVFTATSYHAGSFLCFMRSSQP